MTLLTQGDDMHIIETEVVNEYSTYPEFITKYTVTDGQSSYFVTYDEDKAYDRLHQLELLADLRDM
jgi:hypothetical protein